jgi:peptidoglycan-N-acetylglucosamine deacetylase
MTFHSTRTGFVIITSFIGLLGTFFDVSLAWLLLPGGSFLMLLIYGSASIQSNFFITAHCYTKNTEKQIAISFDDGPNPEFTPQVLRALAQYNATATFFVIGKNISGNENILKQIDAAGHSIGNHSYTHSVFIDFKSEQGLIEELTRTTESVLSVIDKRMTLFRPPYGVITPSLAKTVSLLDYRVIGWSVRSFDTTSNSADAIAQRVQSQIQSGAIILFHDTSDKSIVALKQTLEFAKNNDYKVVSIDQLLKINAYE